MIYKPAHPSDALVRYLVSDVDRAVSFYVERLGFQLVQRPGPQFAVVSRGKLSLFLSGPETSGARPLPDGRRQESGGWNRIVLWVDDVAAEADKLKRAGVRFRNDIQSGPGGKQILLEDPDGNPLELHQGA